MPGLRGVGRSRDPRACSRARCAEFKPHTHAPRRLRAVCRPDRTVRRLMPTDVFTPRVRRASPPHPPSTTSATRLNPRHASYAAALGLPDGTRRLPIN
eukprot:2030982-Prymnesium_polylepis.1